MVCVPGAATACYSGLAGTDGVGACKQGIKICNAQGTANGPCTGEIVPVPENCATVADDDCDGAPGPACAGGLWSKRFGDGTSQSGFSVQGGPAGEVALAGRCQGTFDFGGALLTSTPGVFDICLAKLDAAGNHVWSRQLFAGDGTDDRNPTVAFTASGDVVLASGFQGSVDAGGGVLPSAGASDIVVARYGAAGAHQWSKRFGDAAGQEAYALAIDPGGNVVFAGGIKGAPNFGGGPLVSAGKADAFVTKLDGAGNHLWSKRFGDAGDQVALGVATDQAGNVIVAGVFQGTIDLGGGPLVSTGISFDFFVAKLDAAGNHLWSKRFGGTGNESFIRVATGPQGEIVLGGILVGTVDFGGGPLTTAGMNDAFVAKLDPAGAHVWSKRFGDSDSQYVLGLAVDGLGQIALTGSLQGTIDLGGGALTSAGSADVFLAKLTPAGAPIWSQRFGDAGSQTGRDVAFDLGGNLLVTGWFGGTLDFGSGALVAQGGDLFVAKLAP
jgi:hypothetical protein